MEDTACPPHACPSYSGVLDGAEETSALTGPSVLRGGLLNLEGAVLPAKLFCASALLSSLEFIWRQSPVLSDLSSLKILIRLKLRVTVRGIPAPVLGGP